MLDPDMPPGDLIAEGVVVDHRLDEDGVTERTVARWTVAHDPETAGTRTEYLPAPDDGSPEHVAEIVNGPQEDQQ